jgi:hypothetical protein
MENADRPAYGFVDNRSGSYEDNEVHYGLTKREYFAAMALQGILSGAGNHFPDGEASFEYTAEIAARMANIAADKLILYLGKS